jgi:hypothetical protein
MEPSGNIQEAKAANLVDSAESTQERPFPNCFGGRFEVPEDFDDPLPPEILRYFT